MLGASPLAPPAAEAPLWRLRQCSQAGPSPAISSLGEGEILPSVSHSPQLPGLPVYSGVRAPPHHVGTPLKSLHLSLTIGPTWVGCRWFKSPQVCYSSHGMGKECVCVAGESYDVIRAAMTQEPGRLPIAEPPPRKRQRSLHSFLLEVAKAQTPEVLAH